MNKNSYIFCVKEFRILEFPSSKNPNILVFILFILFYISMIEFSNAQIINNYQCNRFYDMLNLDKNKICNFYANNLFRKMNACTDGQFKDLDDQQYVSVQMPNNDGFYSILIDVAGYSDSLSRFKESGYENIRSVIVIAYNHKKEAIHYLISYQALYNSRSFSSVLNSNGINTIIIDELDGAIQDFQNNKIDADFHKLRNYEQEQRSTKSHRECK